MAIYTNTFEGGTNGATITTGNSGGVSGRAFDQVTANITYTTDAMHGSLAATTAAGSTQYGRWSFTDGPVLLRSYHKFASVADGSTPMRVNLTSGSVFASVMNAGNAGRIQLYMGSGRATSPSAISPNAWYRFELYVQPHASSGVLRLAVYEGDATTAWWDSGNVTGLAVADIVSEIFGKYDASPAQVTWDSVGLKTGADAVWGAWPVQTVMPVADAGEHQASLSGSTVNLNGSGSTNTNSYSWAFLWPSSGAPTLTGAATATPSFTAGAVGSIYAVQLTASNGSQTDTDTVNIAVVSSVSPSTSDLVWTGAAWE